MGVELIASYDQLKNVTKAWAYIIGHPHFPVIITIIQYDQYGVSSSRLKTTPQKAYI